MNRTLQVISTLLYLVVAVRSEELLDKARPESDSLPWWLQPIRRPTVPPPLSTAGEASPIDCFIESALAKLQLGLAPRTDPERLIRRLSFGVTGLPPTPEMLTAFGTNRHSEAYESLLNRLLDSPAYGERWARHWLDLVRYGETDGFEHDAVRPNAWRYRDYVIQALNFDKPFDRFVQEQIAGDELWPEDPQARVATGFALLGPDMVDSADQIQRRWNTLADVTDTLSLVFLGQTLACARCHDHKTEPFTQRDYYGVLAHFAGVEFLSDFPIPSPTDGEHHQAAEQAYEGATKGIRAELRRLEAGYRSRLLEGKLAQLSSDAQLAHRTPKGKRTLEQENTVQETASQVRLEDAELVEAMSLNDRRQREGLLASLKKLPKPSPLPAAACLRNSDTFAPTTFVLARGDYNQPREAVTASVPAIFRLAGTTSYAGSSDSGLGRRSSLAQWLTARENPLVARVMVNRIWQHHFGRGIVATPSDFGTRGATPSHPELLDWLAAELIESGWSMKHIQRLILRSRTYQQSCAASAEARLRDPENRWFSRQNRVRLEGEAIRDSLLAISGQLNSRIGGPGVQPPLPAALAKNAQGWVVSPDMEDHHRRSLYIFSRRNLRFPFLEVFDAPDSNLSCAMRGQSITAPQALTLLNSDEMMVSAQATAAQVEREASEDAERVELAYRKILGRAPSPDELRFSREFLGQSPLAELCRALFNSNAFVYVD